MPFVPLRNAALSLDLSHAPGAYSGMAVDLMFILFVVAGVAAGVDALRQQRAAGARNRARLDAEDARRAARLAQEDQPR